MQTLNVVSALIGMLLAGVVGMLAQRTSMCSVKAVMEVMTTGRPFMLAGFMKTALWVLLVTAGLKWLAGDTVQPAAAYRLSLAAIGGGVLFGVGAVINGGCALSTLSRLATGKFVVLFSLAGFAAGVGIRIPSDRWPLFSSPVVGEPLIDTSEFVPAIVVVGGTAIWALHEIGRMMRARPPAQPFDGTESRERRRKEPIRLSTAAVWIGVSTGILYAFAGSWAYTGTLSDEIRHLAGVAEAPGLLSWLFGAALFAGAVVGSWRSGRLSIDAGIANWHKFLAGGFLMGMGVSLIPGGNDVLILHSVPALSPHALPVFAAMLAGIAGTLFFVRLRHPELPGIDCRGDVCREVLTSKST